MALKYKLKRMLFPRRHKPVVREIVELLVSLKFIRSEIQRYDKLMEHGYIGDKLWDNYQARLWQLERCKKLLELKKIQYKNSKI